MIKVNYQERLQVIEKFDFEWFKIIQNFPIDAGMDDKVQSDASLLSLTDASLRAKNDSESIVRGILSNSIKYNHEKQSGMKKSNKKKNF